MSVWWGYVQNLTPLVRLVSSSMITTFSFPRIYLSLFLTCLQVSTQLYLIIFNKFILFWPQKLVHYASALYYVKFVVIILQEKHLLPVFRRIMHELTWWQQQQRSTAHRLAVAAAAAAAMTTASHRTQLTLNIFSNTHYKYSTHYDNYVYC